MDRYQPGSKYDLAETCAASISVDDLVALSSDKTAAGPLSPSTKLTYGAIRGSKGLRENLARIYSEDGGKQLKEEHFLICPGAIQANFLVLYSLLGPGDHAICVYPTYQQLYSMPESVGAYVSLWRLRGDDAFVPDVSELEGLMKPETKMIIIK